MKIKELRDYTNWFRDNIPDLNFHFNFEKLEPGDIKHSDILRDDQIDAFRAGNICGTIACFTGHLPREQPSSVVAFAERFDLSIDTTIALTHPTQQKRISRLLPRLEEYATKDEVCNMIDLFCSLVESGQIKPNPYGHYLNEEDYA